LGCDETFCPYCWQPGHPHDCVHVLATGFADPGEGGLDPSPFDGLDLPCLPAELDVSGGWSDDQKAAAFGNLVPFLEAYSGGWGGNADDGLWDAPNETTLLFAMLQDAKIGYEEIVDLSGFPSMSAWCAVFVPDQDAAKARIVEVVEQLRQGFERLATMPPEAPTGGESP